MTGCYKCGKGAASAAVYTFITAAGAIQSRRVTRYVAQCTTCGFTPNTHWPSKEQAEREWDLMWADAFRGGTVDADA